MNWKRVILAGIVIYIVFQGLGFIMDNVWLKNDYDQLKNVWRQNMMSRIWLLYVVGLLVAFLFTYIFVKGREGKGIQEGVRFGIIIWLFTIVPFNIEIWVIFPIPYMLVLKWLIFGLLTSLIGGILAAVIYKPAAPAKPQP
jgi:heme/copper-type cytochrome/quinol oxidase subunit 2